MNRQTNLDRIVVEWNYRDFTSENGLTSHVRCLWRVNDGIFGAPWRRGQVILYSAPLTPPAWKPSAKKDFLRAIGHIDKQLRERVIEALSSICSQPVELMGNTKSPMQGNLSGLWRYGIGDFRIIYRPVAETKQVELLSFRSRQDAYNNVDA